MKFQFVELKSSHPKLLWKHPDLGLFSNNEQAFNGWALRRSPDFMGLQKRIIYLFDKSNEQQGIISFIVSFWNENSSLGVVEKCS